MGSARTSTNHGEAWETTTGPHHYYYYYKAVTKGANKEAGPEWGIILRRLWVVAKEFTTSAKLGYPPEGDDDLDKHCIKVFQAFSQTTFSHSMISRRPSSKLVSGVERAGHGTIQGVEQGSSQRSPEPQASGGKIRMNLRIRFQMRSSSNACSLSKLIMDRVDTKE